MRDKRDSQALIRRVSPFPPVSRVSLRYPAWCDPVVPDVQTNEIPAYPQSFPQPAQGPVADMRFLYPGGSSK